MLPEIMNLLRKFYFMRAFARVARKVGRNFKTLGGSVFCALFSYLYNHGFSVI